MTTKKLMSGLLVSAILVMFSQTSLSMKSDDPSGGDEAQGTPSPRQQRLGELVDTTVASLKEISGEIVVQELGEEGNLFPLESCVQRYVYGLIEELFGGVDKRKDSILEDTLAVAKADSGLAYKAEQKKEEYVERRVSYLVSALEARDTALLGFILNENGEPIVATFIEKKQGGFKPFQISILHGTLLGLVAGEQVDPMPVFSIFGEKKRTPLQARLDVLWDSLRTEDINLATGVVNLSKGKELETGVAQFGRTATTRATEGLKGSDLVKKRGIVDRASCALLESFTAFSAKKSPESFATLVEKYEAVSSFLEESPTADEL
ncbi:MAG: hypothetical protein LBD15_02400 [Holosporales bacterium]|nr:hypothetical protein [Holosporales bacterium]